MILLWIWNLDINEVRDEYNLTLDKLELLKERLKEEESRLYLENQYFNRKLDIIELEKIL